MNMSSRRANCQQTSFVAQNAVTNFESHWNPDFLSSDTIKQWINILRSKKRKKCCTTSSFLPRSVTSIVFVWCQKLKLTQNVFHRTLELFESFLSEHISDKTRSLPSCVMKRIKNPPYASSTSVINNEEIKMELKHRSILYLVSCLQIASKLEDGYKVVNVKQASRLLAEASRPFNPSTIVHSEIHVLSTLHFDVDIPPISEFVNLLLCKLVYVLKRDKTKSSSQNILANIDKIRESSLMLVQSIYLDGSEVKGHLIDAISDSHRDCDSKKKMRLENTDGNVDYEVILASGAISTTSFRLHPAWASHVMKHLYEASGIHPSTIAHVSAVLHAYIEQGIANYPHS